MAENVDNKLLSLPEVLLEQLPLLAAPTNQIEPIKDEVTQIQLQKTPKVILNRLTERDLISICNNENKLKLIKRFNLKEFLVKINRDNLEKLQLEFSTKKGINKCKFCDKIYITAKSLEKHLTKKHIIVAQSPYRKKCKNKQVRFSDIVTYHEGIEYHKCRKCEQIFNNYEELKKHMKCKHKKRKCYICNYCKTSFIERTFFKVHIKLHCDDCGEVFENKNKLIEHKSINCILNLHYCKICLKNFLSLKNLKDHKYDHYGVFYVCDYCKKKLKTKCLLSHHITVKHNQLYTEKLYNNKLKQFNCKYCEYKTKSIFKIEKHVSILTKLKEESNIYKCGRCNQTFDKEHLLIKHKWTHFLSTEQIKECTLNNSTSTITSKYWDNKLNGKLYPIVLLNRLNNIIKPPEIGNNNINQQELVNRTLENNEVNQNIEIKKKKLTKTLFSNYQCNICSKYYSTNYCLNRHIETQHLNLYHKCKLCNVKFQFLTELDCHICSPNNIVHPVLLFDNYGGVINCQKALEEYRNDFDEFSDYDDFEIPDPIVELTEYDSPITYTGEGLRFPESCGSNIEPFNNNNSEIILNN